MRPYARATAGEPLHMSFDCKQRVFEFEFRHDPTIEAPTELFLPSYHYPEGGAVVVSDGTYDWSAKDQTLLYHHGTERDVHHIRVRPKA